MALTGLAAAVWLGLTIPLSGVSASALNRIFDTNNLRELSKCLLERPAPPRAPDGRLDVFAALVAAGHCAELIVIVCKSERLGTAVTIEEVKAHDYTHFPWMRASVALQPRDWESRGLFPLLWEAKPDKDGKRLIAHSTGAVKLR